MKSLFLILFSSALVFSLTACKSKSSSNNYAEPTVAEALAEARAAGVTIYTDTAHGGQTVITYMDLFEVPDNHQGVFRAQTALIQLKRAIQYETRSDYIKEQSVTYIDLALNRLDRCMNRLDNNYYDCPRLGHVG